MKSKRSELGEALWAIFEKVSFRTELPDDAEHEWMRYYARSQDAPQIATPSERAFATELGVQFALQRGDYSTIIDLVDWVFSDRGGLSQPANREGLDGVEVPCLQCRRGTALLFLGRQHEAASTFAQVLTEGRKYHRRSRLIYVLAAITDTYGVVPTEEIDPALAEVVRQVFRGILRRKTAPPVRSMTEAYGVLEGSRTKLRPKE